MTQMKPLRRPRDFDDVCDNITRLEERIGICVEGVGACVEGQGKLAAEVAEVRKDIRAIRSGRDPDASIHDFDPEIAELRRTLKERVKDGKDPMNSDRARAMVHDAIKTVQRDAKADRWDALMKLGKRIAIALIIAYAVGMTYAHFGLHGAP